MGERNGSIAVEYYNAYHRRYYQEHKEKMSTQHKIYMQGWSQSNREKIYIQAKTRRRDLKVRVLIHYGDGKLACVRCGISDVDVLCIDHINGKAGGIKRPAYGVAFYRQLEKLGFPDGFQTLCANCNLKKEIVARQR